MDFTTPEELKSALRTAAQTEMLLSQDGSVPAFVLPEDIATMRYVLDTLMPQIKDLRTRRIIWPSLFTDEETSIARKLR